MCEPDSLESGIKKNMNIMSQIISFIINRRSVSTAYKRADLNGRANLNPNYIDRRTDQHWTFLFFGFLRALKNNGENSAAFVK